MSLAISRKRKTSVQELEASECLYFIRFPVLTVLVLFPLIDDMVLSEDSLQEQVYRSFNLLISSPIVFCWNYGELPRRSERGLCDLIALTCFVSHGLVVQCLERLLRKALSSIEASGLVDKLLISLIMHVKTSSDHQASIAIVRDSLDGEHVIAFYPTSCTQKFD